MEQTWKTELHDLLHELQRKRTDRSIHARTSFGRDEWNALWLRVLELCALLNIDVYEVAA